MAAQGELPRVALLFMSKGDMPLESVWRTMLQEAAKEQLPGPTQKQWAWVMESDETHRVHEQLLQEGQYTAQSAMHEADCVDNKLIQVCRLLLLLTAHPTDSYEVMQSSAGCTSHIALIYCIHQCAPTL